jgi:hypothetical protein
MNDPKLDKGGAYEINLPKMDLNVFTCDNPRGSVASGAEVKINFNFTPPPDDPLVSELEVLQGIGQWVEVVCDGKLTGGFTGTEGDTIMFDVILKAYIKQI